MEFFYLVNEFNVFLLWLYMCCSCVLNSFCLVVFKGIFIREEFMLFSVCNKSSMILEMVKLICNSLDREVIVWGWISGYENLVFVFWRFFL